MWKSQRIFTRKNKYLKKTNDQYINNVKKCINKIQNFRRIFKRTLSRDIC